LLPTQTLLILLHRQVKTVDNNQKAFPLRKGFFYFKKALRKTPTFYPVKTPIQKTGISTLLQMPGLDDFCMKVLIIVVSE
jgi:hypothetical protein